MLDKEAKSLHPLSVWFLSLIVLEFPSESSEDHASIAPLSTMAAKTFKLFFINRYFFIFLLFLFAIKLKVQAVVTPFFVRNFIPFHPVLRKTYYVIFKDRLAIIGFCVREIQGDVVPVDFVPE